MTLRTGLILVLFIALAGCSDNSSNEAVEEYSSTLGGNSSNNPISDDYSIVCGVFFNIKDFDQWQKSYKSEAQNSIIYLRSADDPNMVVIFEANQTLEAAKKRVEDLVGDNFSQIAGVEGEPVADYYDVIYYKPSKISDTHYMALSFRIKDNAQLDIFSDSNFDHFTKLGLRPIGLGSNPIKPDEVYMLLTVKDLDSIRKMSNTAGKMKKFLAELGLPTSASMSYWAKP